MLLPAHIDQLRKTQDLATGLEWAALCPDEAARRALVVLIAEEVGAGLAGVIYAAEAGAKAEPATN